MAFKFNYYQTIQIIIVGKIDESGEIFQNTFFNCSRHFTSNFFRAVGDIGAYVSSDI